MYIRSWIYHDEKARKYLVKELDTHTNRAVVIGTFNSRAEAMRFANGWK